MKKKPVLKSGNPWRRSLVTFRVTGPEKIRIETRARKLGLTVSQLLRSLTLGLIVCISRAPAETHWTGDVFGHVSEGYSWVDPEIDATLACQHDGETCETVCWESR